MLCKLKECIFGYLFSALNAGFSNTGSKSISLNSKVKYISKGTFGSMEISSLKV
jgi:hypothetical protein